MFSGGEVLFESFKRKTLGHSRYVLKLQYFNANTKQPSTGDTLSPRISCIVDKFAFISELIVSFQ